MSPFHDLFSSAEFWSALILALLGGGGIGGLVGAWSNSRKTEADIDGITAEALGQTATTPPVTTAMGALLNHITTGANADTFQPMNVNFGLFPPVDDAALLREGKRKVDSKDRKRAMSHRALADFDVWVKSFKSAA